MLKRKETATRISPAVISEGLAVRMMILALFFSSGREVYIFLTLSFSPLYHPAEEDVKRKTRLSAGRRAERAGMAARRDDFLLDNGGRGCYDNKASKCASGGIGRLARFRF